MNAEFQEPIRKKVGGSLSNIPVFQRLEMLRRNALFLRGGKWEPPPDDGTLVRKMVGWPPRERPIGSPEVTGKPPDDCGT